MSNELMKSSVEESSVPPKESRKVPPLSPLSFMLIISAGLLFLATLCPTVFVGDAGDFITACYKRWIPHPPGYPVYTILGWLLTRIPTSFTADSVALKRLLAMVFMLGAGIFGVVYIIRNREKWVSSLIPNLGYIIGGFIGLFIAKTVYSLSAGSGDAGEASAGLDLMNPPSAFFAMTVLAFFIIIFISGYIGTRSRKVRGSTYLVSIILFAILSPILFFMVKYLVPPTVDPVQSQPALMVNLLSAIAGFLTIIFAYLTFREVIPIEAVCGIGAFLIAVGRTYWAQAEIAEVYTLNTAFIFGIFYLGFSYIRTRAEWRFYLMAFVMGIALAHHYSILLFYPGLLYYIALKTGGIAGLRKSLVPVKRVLIGLVLAIIGLFPYYYLSWVHYETPLEYVVFNQEDESRLRQEGVDKVRYEPAGELDYFVKISSRGVYTEAREHEKSEANIQARTTTPQVFNRYAALTVEEFTIPLALFGLLGLLLGMRFRPGWLLPIWIVFVLFTFIEPVKAIAVGGNADELTRGVASGGFSAFWFTGGERLIWFLLAMALSIWCMRTTYLIVFGSAYLFYFGVVHFFPSEDILNAPMVNLEVVMPPLVVPLHALWACFAVFFIAYIYRWIKDYAERMSEIDKTDPSIKTATFRMIAVAVFTALVIFTGYVNWPYGDKSRSLIAYNYARNVMNSCEPFTAVMTTGDEIFMFWYLQEVEGYRPDVHVTNWIHNIYGLEELGNEMDTMAGVIDRFLQETSATGWKLVSTYLVPSFLKYESITSRHVVMDGLLYRFEDQPPYGFAGKVDLGEIPDGDRMQVVDEIRDMKLDPSGTPPNSGYYWGGINPLVDSSDFSEYEKKRVYLDPQEKEMLARYQDTFLHAGLFRMKEGRRFDSVNLDDYAQTQYDKAAKHFRSLVSLDPADVVGWLELGETYLYIGYPEWAEVCFTTILKKDNADDSLKAEAHGSLALMYYQMKEYDRARSEAEQSIILDPANAKALHVRGLLGGDTGAITPPPDENEGLNE